MFLGLSRNPDTVFIRCMCKEWITDMWKELKNVMCLHHHLFYLHSIIFVVVICWCRASYLPLFSNCNKCKYYPATHKHTKPFRTHLICVRKQWWYCLFSQRYGAPGCSPTVWISYTFKKQAVIHSFVCNKTSEGLIFCSMW